MKINSSSVRSSVKAHDSNRVRAHSSSTYCTLYVFTMYGIMVSSYPVPGRTVPPGPRPSTLPLAELLHVPHAHTHKTILSKQHIAYCTYKTSYSTLDTVLDTKPNKHQTFGNFKLNLINLNWSNVDYSMIKYLFDEYIIYWYRVQYHIL